MEAERLQSGHRFAFLVILPSPISEVMIFAEEIFSFEGLVKERGTSVSPKPETQFHYFLETARSPRESCL